MTRIRKLYSYFCKKRPQKDLSFACVYFPGEKIWRVCIGKLYLTGRFRYIHNGIEGIADKYNFRYKQHAKPAELQKLAIDLNKRNLEIMFPKPWRKHNWIDHYWDELPVVAEEDNDDDLTIG